MSQCAFKEQIDKAIVDGEAKVLVATAQEIADQMVIIKNGKVDKNKSVSTSQIRNIFGTIKKTELSLSQDNVDEKYASLLLLKPKLAYVNGRHNKDGKKSSFTVMVSCLTYAIDILQGKPERMKNFFNFFEAILAYHRAKGGE